MRNTPIILILLSLAFITCKKKTELTELEKLPPATKEGKNTFGCLINGKAWTPKGYRPNTPNYYIVVDPGFADGDLSIRTYRIDNGIYESITINSDSVKTIGDYQIDNFKRTRAIYRKWTEGLTQLICDVEGKGTLTITKYDLANGIISGTFEFAMVNPACGYGDTIRVANGRFDKKL